MLENFESARREWYEDEFTGLERCRYIPAMGRCCGRVIVLSDFTNTCEACGADYNKNGSRLAPRSQWGEETGEAWFDCY